jgi:hypothetical protein
MCLRITFPAACCLFGEKEKENKEKENKEKENKEKENKEKEKEKERRRRRRQLGQNLFCLIFEEEEEDLFHNDLNHLL